MGMRIGMVALIFLAGCTLPARMVQTSETYGGVQEGPRGGVVEYLSSSSSIWDAFGGDSRKEEAIRKMRDYCYPHPYRVVRTDRRITYGTGGVTISGGKNPPPPSLRSYEYTSVHFQCVKPEGPPKRSVIDKSQLWRGSGRCQDLDDPKNSEWGSCLLIFIAGGDVPPEWNMVCLDPKRPAPLIAQKSYVMTMMVPERFANWEASRIDSDGFGEALANSSKDIIEFEHDFNLNGHFDDSRFQAVFGPLWMIDGVGRLSGLDLCGGDRWLIRLTTPLLRSK